MIPIFLCSIISFALVLERFLYLRRSKIFPRLMMKEIDSLNLSSDFSEIETICKKYDEISAAEDVIKEIPVECR